MSQGQQQDPVAPGDQTADESPLDAEALDAVAGGLIIEPFDPYTP